VPGFLKHAAGLLAAIVMAAGALLLGHWVANQFELLSAYNAATFEHGELLVTGDSVQEGKGEVSISFEERNMAIVALRDINIPSDTVSDVILNIDSVAGGLSCSLIFELIEKPPAAAQLGIGCETKNVVPLYLEKMNDVIHSIRLVIKSSRGSAVQVRDVSFSFKSYSDKLRYDFISLLNFPYHWDQRAINYMQAGKLSGGLPVNYVYLVFMAVSALFYFVILKIVGSKAAVPDYLAVIFTVWMVMDGRWMAVVYDNARNAYDAYSGKTYNEKRLVGLTPADGYLYGYAAGLARDIFSGGAKKIIVIYAGDAPPYAIGRIIYDLIPNKMYGVGESSNKVKWVGSFFDYVIVDKNVREIYFDKGAGVLKAKGEEEDERLATVVPVSDSRYATVYRVGGDAGLR